MEPDMKWRMAALWALVLTCPASSAVGAPRELPAPETYFGHLPGADRTIIDYDQLVAYFKKLDEGSDRVELMHLGKTTEGRDFVMLAISTPENLANAAHYREVAAALDDPRGRSPEAIDRLVAEGKVILFVSLNIHSDEIAVSQMSPEWVYALATGGPESPARYLQDVIVLLVPSLNPDGQVMIANWYRKYLGTPYEGSDFPRLYHTYAGHDNNRDWFMLNLAETRLVNTALYHEWHPQVVVDEHQMGRNGPRIFVPPYTDPITETVHPLVHRETQLLGSEMAMALEQSGKSGVIYGYAFDAYWPGGTRSTPWWKNTIGILTETASTQLMTPVFVKPSELKGDAKGLSEYRAQVNFPHPWPGGWWRPRDIVDYALVVTNSALESCSSHREELLRNRATMSLDAVHLGKTEAPYAYVIPRDQWDPGAADKLVTLMLEHGVEVKRIPGETHAGDVTVPANSFVIPTAQPYRPFILEMLEPQSYPQVKSDEAGFYDVTAWTLPYLMGVTCNRIDVPVMARLEAAHVLNRVHEPSPDLPVWALSPRENNAYEVVARLLKKGQTVRQLTENTLGPSGQLEAGTFLTDAPSSEMSWAFRDIDLQRVDQEPRSAKAPRQRTLRLPRIGIYQSWLAATDEGWTRFVLDAFEFPYTVLHNQDIQAGQLRTRFDAIVLPDQTRDEIMEGRRAAASEDTSPSVPEFTGGLGHQGREALREFLHAGGTVIALGDASSFAIHELRAPVRDVTETLSRDEFSTPGTILRVSVNGNHPLGYGMPEHAFVYCTNDPVLAFPAGRSPQGTIVLRFEDGPQVVASGWAGAPETLYGKGALVETSAGKGRMVLFGFRPQYRGQTQGTYRLLFNALLNSAAE
jgi:hypothetical protein